MYAKPLNYKKPYLDVICSFISVVITCAKGHSIIGTNITCEGNTSQPWTLFCKKFMPKRYFLHKSYRNTYDL